MAEIKLNKSWKNLFPLHILERGYDYYLYDHVQNIRIKPDRVIAMVSGTEDYDVVLRIEDGYVKELSCSCPYADGGIRCKHEAAVLYELEDMAGASGATGTGDGSPENGDADNNAAAGDMMHRDNSEKLIDAVDRIPEEDLRDLVIEIAEKDEALKNKIISTWLDNLDDRYIDSLKRMVDNFEYEYGDRSGFIDWRNATGYIMALEEFLADNVRPLINRDKLREAFDLTCYVFVTIGNAVIDDDGDIENGARSCMDMWYQIAEQASDDFQMEMYKWFKETTENDTVIDYMEDYLDEFMLTGFHTKELLLIRRSELDAMISSEARRIVKDGGKWKTPYYFAKNVELMISTMEELGCMESEIREYYEKYSYAPAIRMKFAERLCTCGEFDAAVEMMLSGKMEDAEDTDAVVGYSRKLIEIYNRQERGSELRQELEYQIFSHAQTSMSYIHMLKELSDKTEWEETRKRMLSSKTCCSVRRDILAEEEMLELLLEDLEITGNLWELERYEDKLRPAYDKKILQIRQAALIEAAERANTRSRYSYLATDLKKLLRYEGGREAAIRIANAWKVQYSRRPAMMDELRKAGF